MISNAVGQFFANAMLHPAEQPIPKTPLDYGLEYRNVIFEASDGIRLSGWLLNESAERCVIMTHFGYRANRYGYQVKHQPFLTRPYKKDIEFIRVAKQLTDAGYAVLMYDLRNHGESEFSELGVGTGGVDERNDVFGAVHFVANDRATSGKPIGLLSYCMGANASICAMAEDPDFFPNAGVQSMVAVQPLTNGLFLEAYGIKGRYFAAAEEHFRSQTGGISMNYALATDASSVSVPTRLVQSRKDSWTNFDFIKEVYNQIPTEKEMLWLEEPTHRFDGYNWLADHPEDMLSWFDSYLPVASRTLSA